MLRFLTTNFRWLAAGFLLTFASACGQTWFIALSATAIKHEYGLSDGGWGGIYTLATLTSALMIFWQGSIIDRVPARLVFLVTALGCAAAAVGLSASRSVWLLGISIFLLRFCGQGMFGHIAMTTIGRWFLAQRGRAVAIANLGYPAGEIILSAPAILAIEYVGYRGMWAATAAVLVLLITPVAVILLATDRTPQMLEAAATTTGLAGRHWTRREVVRHWLLPALLPVLLTPGFMGTVLFFNQTHVATVKGWTLVMMAPGFTCFAISVVITSFVSGWAVDRFGPAKLLPVMLVPIGLAMALIGSIGHVSSWYIGLGLMGMTMGMGGSLSGVLLPTAYGTQHLGAIRSLSTTIMVFSTAIGPGLTGFLIDAGVDFSLQCLVCAGWCLIVSAGSILTERRLSRELAAAT
jgi:sugar phosphate permease